MCTPKKLFIYVQRERVNCSKKIHLAKIEYTSTNAPKSFT